MPLKQLSAACAVGDFYVLLGAQQEGLTYPNYDQAEAQAHKVCKNHPGREVFIVQVCGHFRGVTSPVQVMPA